MIGFSLVDLAGVKAFLNVYHDEDDTKLSLLISSASRAVVRYIGNQAGEVLGIDSPPNSPPDNLSTVPEDVQLAVMHLVGFYYLNPDNDRDKAFPHGYLPDSVTSLLYPLRMPTVA